MIVGVSLLSDDFVKECARGSSWNSTIAGSTGLDSSMMVSSMIEDARLSSIGMARDELMLLNAVVGRSDSHSACRMRRPSSRLKLGVEQFALTSESTI